MSTTATFSAASLSNDTHGFDRALLFAALALACFGLVMVYSVSSLRASELYSDQFYFLKRQAAYFGIGILFLVASMRVHPETWRRMAYPLLGVTLLLLVLVLIPGIGTQVGGARRWIRLGPVSIQPGELAKLAMVLYMARSISRKKERMQRFSVGILPHGIVMCLLAALLLAEPDLGTVLTTGLVCVAMLFIGGARATHLLAVAASMVPPVAYLIWDSPYRLKRVMTFLDPWGSPHSDGFQIIQSFLAFGSGGIAGRGLGDSQQKLFFLPEAHTDFILSVIGEELGLIGVSILIATYAFLFVRGIRVALRCCDPFCAVLAAGITLLIGIEAFTNAAVVMGLLPTKGLTLPLISFGGSSLIVTLWGCGILLSLSAKG